MKIIYVVLVVIVLAALLEINMALKEKKLRKLLPDVLTPNWISGRDLRQKLHDGGLSLSYGTFYVLMNKLRDRGLVKSQDIKEQFEGEDVSVRQFRSPW